MPVRTDSEIAGAAKAAGFTGQDIAVAVAVALAESSGRDDATNRNTNGSTDYGTWQINSIHKDILASGDWRNLASNARMARRVFTDAGNSWRPWSTFKSGSYLRYMARGQIAAGNPADPGVTGGTPGVTTDRLTADPSTGLAFFTAPGLWARVGVTVLGGALLVFALWQLTGVGDTAITAGKALVSARTGGLLG